MTLDNEAQKQQLLGLIRSSKFSGEGIETAYALLAAVSVAKVAPAAGAVAVDPDTGAAIPMPTP